MIMIMHCPGVQDIRDHMFDQIENLENSTGVPIIVNSLDTLSVIMGKMPDDIQPDTCLDFLKIVAHLNVYKMYQTVMMHREGDG